MLRPRLLFSLLTLAALGSGAFFAARYFTGGSSAEAQLDAPVAPSPEVLEQDRQKPRFVGELLGIYISPSEKGPFPPGHRATRQDVCGSTPTARVPAERAGELGLNLTLPPDYIFQPGDMDTGVWACGDTVVVAKRVYEHKAANGMTSRVLIGRSRLTVEAYDVSADRVKVTSFAGRPAILIEPVTSDAVIQRSGVIFPEPFGKTFIDVAYLPLDELKRLAEAVAEATK